MSVTLEFAVDADEFTLGSILSGPPDVELELERIVPTGEDVVPYVWASGQDLEAFEETVRDSPHVESLLALDSVDGKGLYRIDWAPTHESDLVDGIASADGAVLEASGTDAWTFRLRFPDHDDLSQFYTYCTDNDVPIHVERTYTTKERGPGGQPFDISQKQREAILLALRRGYFATPKQVSLDELADELDISRQALSNRIRGANERILETTLLSSLATDERSRSA